ncbi:PDZ domain-containing protein [Nocardioides sp. JQ2195]|uniref:YlbL family protein n=1 Tax=Nocardioides sp. JQ2195 TaxID=2592334 RepID=UPI00143EAFB7|nr:PDZ domain-containing protein [Nocardioides sp. JQ2195]QIX27607.1 PDZ domain-containing protein [Nocardioides sp. JQ2195]
MTRRTVAIAISVPLLVALWACAILRPVPYVTFQPGVTVDMLSRVDGHERIQITGHKAYYDTGELRMTTVSVTRAGSSVSIFAALQAWFDEDDAVQPYSAVYEESETEESNEKESSLQMVTSQDASEVAALRSLGYDVPLRPRVIEVEKDMPATGKLRKGDWILAINDTRITDAQQVVDLIGASEPGRDISVRVRRGEKRKTFQIAPRMVDKQVRLGFSQGVQYDFPFDIDILIDPEIGGPSAGMMFALAIVDTLTPGSMTNGQHIAGTGTIDDKGNVGPIGGIQQKIPAVRDAGAKLFLVPADNCAEALGADNGDVRLVRVTTLKDAIASVEAWSEDPGADLPSCEKE